jgi:hypothetical protein
LPDNPFSISVANIVSNENQTALIVGGFLEGDYYDDLYCTVFASGSRSKAFRSDEQDFSFEKLIDLGEDYRNSFGKRQNQVSAPARHRSIYQYQWTRNGSGGFL